MEKFTKSKTTYFGISEYIPSDISSFSQMNINKVIQIEDNTPKVDEIIKLHINSEIKNTRIIKTAKGTSLEGQTLTGYKYLAEGQFIVRIDYCSVNNDGYVYTFNVNIPFNNATVLSKNFTFGSPVIENIYIEDIYSQVLNENEIFIDVSFLLIVENY